jgi:hypothetical protein
MTVAACHAPAFVAAAAVALAMGATPVFAAGTRPCDSGAIHRSVTDVYCIVVPDAEPLRGGSPLPTVQCRPKTDWAARPLAISSD